LLEGRSFCTFLECPYYNIISEGRCQ